MFYDCRAILGAAKRELANYGAREVSEKTRHTQASLKDSKLRECFIRIVVFF